MADGRISDRDGLENWIRDLLEIGSGWNDAVFVSAAWHEGIRNNIPGDLSHLAQALAGSAERYLEATAQGAAFAKAARAWPGAPTDLIPESAPLPIAVGVLAGGSKVDLVDTLIAYLQAFASNLIQAALRLLPIGQSDGVAILAKLEPAIRAVALRAAASDTSDLGTATYATEIAAMRHETQSSRIFRS